MCQINYPFAREFWEFGRPLSSGVVYTTFCKVCYSPNLRNKRHQPDKIDLYMHFINKSINLHSNGIYQSILYINQSYNDYKLI